MNVINTEPNFAKAIEAEAAKELAQEKATAAKSKIKDSLKRIAAAEKVLQNLQDEHAVLLADIAS
jgi:hypothetical protein